MENEQPRLPSNVDTRRETHPVTTTEYGTMLLEDLAQLHTRLSLRDAVSRATAQLRAEGRYDPGQHLPLDHPEALPLRPDEHLQLLAVDRAIADTVLLSRQVRVWRARQAGADWPSIAAALQLPAETARADYAAWVDRQAGYWDRCTEQGETPLGLDPGERHRARQLLDDPRPAS
jgi:hypothetical protein